MRTLLALGLCTLFASVSVAEDKLSVLIVDGQNNHKWQKTSPILNDFLKASGRYDVTVATSPPKGAPKEAWSDFDPEFSKFDIVLSNYNGELWPAPVQKKFESYIENGGGAVIIHAANNAFPSWDEYNKMIGLGWRNNKFGPRLTLDDAGKPVVTKTGEGPGAGHGPQHEFSIIVRETEHPVMKGMPREWMHAKDELYHGQRGPAANMHVLATAYSAPTQRGTDANEPMVWWIPYGKGKVLTCVLGHAEYSMHCVGFRTIVDRACEWVATGEVTSEVPDNFPTAKSTSSVKVD